MASSSEVTDDWRPQSSMSRPTTASGSASASASGSGSWVTQQNTMDSSTGDLFFSSLNTLAPVSVVLIHILFSSHLEWAHVWPKLSEYHLLIPDMPHHSRSRHLKPFSFIYAADLIAQMIRDHAHDGRAHLVGISTGGFVAMELVRRHPDVVLSAFCSGSMPLTDFWMRNISANPKVMYLGLAALLRVPSNIFLKASGWSPELQTDAHVAEIKRNVTSKLSEFGTRSTRTWTMKDVEEVGTKDVRIAIVASGKQDDVVGARQVGALLRSTGRGPGSKSRAFVVKDAIHAWNLQLPELFARGVKAWIEDYHLPLDYVPLDEATALDDGAP